MRFLPLIVLISGCGLLLEVDPPTDGGVSPPPPCTSVGAETCNASDDDCDGRVDEDLGQMSCGIGACAVTVDLCTDGAPAVCTPAPMTPEACNALDDDCDGSVDESCACDAYVLQGASGTGERIDPVGTIGEGIARVRALGGGSVCVGAAIGPTTECLGIFREPVTMVDGVQVTGGFLAEDEWPAVPECTTVIRVDDSLTTVHFPDDVGVDTALSSFRVKGADGLAESVGVHFSGGGTLRDVEVEAGASDQSIGVWVTDEGGGSVDIVGGRIIGTRAVLGQSFGLSIQGKSVNVLDVEEIFGGHGSNTLAVRAEGVDGLSIANSNLVAGDGDSTLALFVLDSQNVQVGPGGGVRGGLGVGSSAAVRVGSSTDVLFTDLSEIRGGGGAIVDGVLVTDRSEVVIRRVASVVGRAVGGDTAREAFALFCGDSDCDVEESNLVAIGSGARGLGTTLGFSDGATGNVYANQIQISPEDVNGVGVSLERSGRVTIDANELLVGTMSDFQVGVEISDSEALVTNNFIDLGQNADGINVVFSMSAGRVVDVHSNTIASSGTTSVGGDSRALAGVYAPGASGDVTVPARFRNNILYCRTVGRTPAAFLETDAQPETFDHNILYGCTPLWSMGGVAIDAFDIDAIFTPRGYSMNQVGLADPMITSDGHLMPGSVAIEAGTTDAAPEQDIDGESRRVSTPDIGCDEWFP